MLRLLRNSSGGPAFHVRVLAALVVVGMLGLAAPLLAMIVGPVVRWLLAVL